MCGAGRDLSSNGCRSRQLGQLANVPNDVDPAVPAIRSGLRSEPRSNGLTRSRAWKLRDMEIAPPPFDVGCNFGPPNPALVLNRDVMYSICTHEEQAILHGTSPSSTPGLEATKGRWFHVRWKALGGRDSPTWPRSFCRLQFFRKKKRRCGPSSQLFSSTSACCADFRVARS